MLGPVLGLPVKGRDVLPGLSLTKGHDQETGESLTRREAARDGLSSLEKRRLSGISLMYRNT